MGGNTRSNIGYTLDFYFDLHAVFYLMRLKKNLTKGRGGEGTNTPRPLGYVSFGFSREIGRTTLQEKEGKDGR